MSEIRCRSFVNFVYPGPKHCLKLDVYRISLFVNTHKKKVFNCQSLNYRIVNPTVLKIKSSRIFYPSHNNDRRLKRLLFQLMFLTVYKEGAGKNWVGNTKTKFLLLIKSLATYSI
jgi:hypothetical protein